MTVHFMGNTHSMELEMEMQRIPGFQPRGSGIVVSHETGCRCQRFMAGSRPFGELLEQFAEEVAVSRFSARVSRVAARNPPAFFLTGHRGRFERLWERYGWSADTDAMCAAVYLLSADPFLWGRSCSAVDPDRIRFHDIRIHGVSLDGYVLFHTAKGLYKGTCRIRLSELLDPELVSEDTFRLVVSAFLIRRHGPGVLVMEGNGNGVM